LFSPIDGELPISFTSNREVRNFSNVMIGVSATEDDLTTIFWVVDIPANKN
jgi:hypothetical protein